MKYLILLLLLLSGCTKHYTNEECIKEVCRQTKCDQYDREDRALAEMGASLACSDNNNDPNQAIKSLEGNHD